MGVASHLGRVRSWGCGDDSPSAEATSESESVELGSAARLDDQIGLLMVAAGVSWLTEVGLGLDYESLRLDRTTPGWVDAGAQLRREVSDLLGGLVSGVEQIGSSSVVGLLAKPIVDLAVGVTVDLELTPVRARLESAGWIYRGDAQSQGGHVFVLESAPWRRVAHAHVVEYLGEQWCNYLRLRDLLLRSSEARERYEDTKLRLINEVGDDRASYTGGKSAIIASLLDGPVAGLGIPQLESELDRLTALTGESVHASLGALARELSHERNGGTRGQLTTEILGFGSTAGTVQAPVTTDTP